MTGTRTTGPAAALTLTVFVALAVGILLGAAISGKLGDAETIVNEILAYEPERMLTIRVKQAPASFPHRDARVAEIFLFGCTGAALLASRWQSPIENRT